MHSSLKVWLALLILVALSLPLWAEGSKVPDPWEPLQFLHGRWSSPPVRTYCGDVPRGDPAPGHTAPRACRPRDHLRVPARDRQHRNHPRGPRAASTRDSRRPNPPRLTRAPLSHTGWWCLGPADRVSDTAARGPQRDANRHDPNSASVAGFGKCLQPGILAVLTPPQRVVAEAIIGSPPAATRKRSRC